MDDIDRLLDRIAQRDEAALKALYQQVAARLLGVAWRVLQDRGLAEDVLQEVLLSVWNRSGTPLAGQPLTLAWLCVVTRNRAIDALRKKRPEEPLHWQDDGGEERHHDTESRTASPMEQLLAHEDDERLNLCLAALQSEPRQAMNLAFFEGLTHVEVAQRMRRPLGTVKAWTRRSLQRLKICLEGGL